MIFSKPLLFILFGFRIPKSARKEKEIKRKFGIFLVSQVYDLFVPYLYALTQVLFIIIPSNYQPILGFFCPLLREIVLKILNFITYRAGGGRSTKMSKYFINKHLVLGPI